MTDYVFRPSADQPSKSWDDNGTWTGGVVPGAPDADVIVPTTTNVSDGSVFFSRLIVERDVFDIRSLTLENNELLLNGSASHTTGLNVSGTVDFSAGAQVNLVYATLNAGSIESSGQFIAGLGSTINTISMVNSSLLDGYKDGGLTINANQFTNTGDVTGNVTIHTDAGGYSGLQAGELSGGDYSALNGDIRLDVGDTITSIATDVSLWNGDTIYSYDDSSAQYLDLSETLEEVQADVSLTLFSTVTFYNFSNTYDFSNLNVAGAFHLNPGANGQITLTGNVHILAGGTMDGHGTVTASLTNDGVVEASERFLVIDGPISGGGSFSIAAPGTLQIGSATDQDVAFQDANGALIIDDVDSFSGTLAPSTLGLDGTNDNLIVLDGVDFSQISGVSYIGNASGGTLSFNEAGNVVTLQFAGNLDQSSFVITDGRSLSSDPAKTNIQVKSFVCFVTGTLIRTDCGDVAVEELAVGDRVMTASGALRPVTWIGQRTLTDIADAEHAAAWPVRVKAGAFGTNRPDRDLLLSAGHAVCVDMMGEMFVPVGRLVNGGTIARVPVDEVTYWHVELDSHDVLLSNNLPTESYMDVGNRAWFTGAGEEMLPEEADRSLYSRPFVDAGAIVEAVRLRLAARAEAMGWSRTSDMDPHLIVDGVRVDGDIDGDIARFIFPASARDVRLLSRCFVPAHERLDGDTRSLGLCLTGMEFSDGLRATQDVAVDAPLFDGQHAMEQDGDRRWRWINGELPIDASLWDGFRSHVILGIDLLPSQGQRWVAPAVIDDCHDADMGRVVALRR